MATRIRFPTASKLQRKLALQRMRQSWEDPLKLIPAEVAVFRYQEWWVRAGRYLLWFVIIFTTLSIILTLTASNYYYLYFMSPSPISNNYDFCAEKALRYNTFVQYFSGVLIFILVCFMIAA